MNLIVSILLLFDELLNKNFCNTAAGSDADIAGSSSENDEQRHQRTTFARRHPSRDSGCYDGHKRTHVSPQSDVSDHGDKNNLDSVVEQCNNEILARVGALFRFYLLILCNLMIIGM